MEDFNPGFFQDLVLTIENSLDGILKEVASQHEDLDGLAGPHGFKAWFESNEVNRKEYDNFYSAYERIKNTYTSLGEMLKNVSTKIDKCSEMYSKNIVLIDQIHVTLNKGYSKYGLEGLAKTATLAAIEKGVQVPPGEFYKTALSIDPGVKTEGGKRKRKTKKRTQKKRKIR